jgi:hypothetical protein
MPSISAPHPKRVAEADSSSHHQIPREQVPGPASKSTHDRACNQVAAQTLAVLTPSDLARPLHFSSTPPRSLVDTYENYWSSERKKQ